MSLRQGVQKVLATIVGIVALLLIVGGAHLIAAGGSAYYAIAGAALLAFALATYRARWRLADRIYAVLLVGTAIWAVSESGLDPWALLPRLGLLTSFGILFVFLDRHPARRMPVTFAAIGLVVVLAIAAVARNAAGAATAVDLANRFTSSDDGSDWVHYGNSAHGTRFSPLTQITPENASTLKVAWTYRFGGKPVPSLQVTPIKIGDSLYACSGLNVVVALDPETGLEKWRFDPHVDLESVPTPQCRGVTYFRSSGAPDAACAERIFTNTIDARLIALDARTGKPCAGFGADGVVDLREDLGNTGPGRYFPTSAPLLARNKIIVGGLVPGKIWPTASGVVRAFDAVTGRLLWALDVGKTAEDPANAPPYTHSTTNVWAPMSYDDESDMIYAPTGATRANYYGAWRRPFDDEFNTSVFAIEADTGRLRWHFRTVNHDIWDYDVASQPTLLDLRNDRGGLVKALLQPTKRGQIFLLDRTTGHPIAKVEQRPAPQRGALPEEPIARTQPVSVEMPVLDDGELTERRMWGLTPLDQLWCRLRFRQARYEGPFTPPGLTPSILHPGYLGGMNWGSASVDPERGVMVVGTNYMANVLQLVPRAEAERLGVTVGNHSQDRVKDLANWVVMYGLPYSAKTTPFLSPLDVPCNQPPWSRLTAIDLASRRVLWSKPLGTGRDSGPLGTRSFLSLPIGVPLAGGSLITRSGLVFIGATVERSFRAISLQSGQILWESRLPAAANATPMTYRGPQSGRQFVVVASGGHLLLRAPTSDYLMAFALPSEGAPANETAH